MSETAAVEILNGFADFLLAVHHKRAVTDNRLINRLAAEEQDNRIFGGFQQNGAVSAVSAVQDHQLAGVQWCAAVDINTAVQNDQSGVAAGFCRQSGDFSGFQAHPFP